MKGFLAGTFALLALLLAPAIANAATVAVNTQADEYGSGPDCSLREAITAAQTNAPFGGCPAGFGGDTITLPGGEYKITRAGAGEDANATGDFDIAGVNALEIRAAGPEDQVTIDGNGLDRVFSKTSTGDLKLTALRVTGGLLTGIEDGGGILAGVGVTELEDVTVDGNVSPISGGGIAVYAQLQMVNSTISGNSSGGNGGGFYVPGGATATARSSTIYGNKADSDGDGNGYGGGFALAGGVSVNFTNVINAGNSGTSPVPGNNASDCYSGPFYFPRYSLQNQPIGPADCLVGFNQSSISVADAMIDPTLRYNGGQTPTHNLLEGSPAIGAGGTAAPDQCPPIDQNGIGRVAGSCDIGSTTYVPAPKVPQLKLVKVLPKKKVIRRKKAKPITVVITNSGTAPLAGARVCLKLPKASRKGLKIKGKACRAPGALEVGQVKRPKIRLGAKRRAKRKAYVVRLSVSATDQSTITRRIKVRVK